MKKKKQVLVDSLLLILVVTNISIFSNDKKAQNIHRYMWANYKHAGGKLEEAKKWYNEIMDDTNKSIYPYKGYIYLLRDTGQIQEIVSLIPKLESHTSITNDPAIQLVFIQALEKTGNRDQAIKKIITVNDQHKGHQEIAFFTANLYLKRNEPKNALIVIDNFLQNCQRKPNNFIFYFLKAQILLSLKEKEKAREQVTQCLQMHPNFDKGWLFYAMLEEELGNIHDAIKAFTTFLELVGGNKPVEQHVLKLILKQKMDKNKTDMISIDGTTVKKALLLFEQKRFQEALDQLQNYLESPIPKASLTVPRSTVENLSHEHLYLQVSFHDDDEYTLYAKHSIKMALEQSMLLSIEFVSPPSFLAY